MGKVRSIPLAARELCLAFPGAEEFESHGSPNYRSRLGTRKGRTFATWALNHHGDGHVALWLNTPALEQSRLLASSRHIYKPPYVGPSGWIAVELNKGVSWKRVRELVHMAYLNSAPPKQAASMSGPPAVAPPTAKMKPAEIDRLKSSVARKAIVAIDKVCAELPDVTQGTQMGSVAWRAGKRSFCMLFDYGKGLTAQFWVGIERQGPLEMDPRLKISRYLGHKGWMDLDLTRGWNARELREFVIESYRHFASRRALEELDTRRRAA